MTMRAARFERIEALRASIFGEIVLCRDTQTREEVIIKTVDLSLALKQRSRTHESVQENILKEIEVLRQLSMQGGHPNVINMRQYYVTRSGCFLHVVLDYCRGGDLLDACMPPSAPALTSTSTTSDKSNNLLVTPPRRRIDEYTALRYLNDVLAGLSYLHSNGIAHRDISLENILLLDGRAVITDFGLCAQQEKHHDDFSCTEIVGKHYYMAPEIVARSRYDPKKADIWSVGVSFFILLTSSPPFERASPTDPGFRYVSKHGVKAVFRAWALDNSVSAATQDLLESMMVIDPLKRITMNEIMQHPALVSTPLA